MDLENRRLQAAQLFAFIREYTRLSQKPVESLDSYIETFWLDEVPQEPECVCVAWLRPQDYSPETVIETTWLSINRPEPEDPPDVPVDVQDWVDERQWEDSSLEFPELHERILNVKWPETEPGDHVPQFIHLEQFPEISKSWENYVTDEWRQWAEEDRRRARVQECYNELFSMHRTQFAMGEQYEFLLAAGCLHWATSTVGQVIKRHLLTLPVNIEFDSENAVVSVVTAGGTAEVQLEVDMLKVEVQPGLDIAEDAEMRRGLLGDNLFHPDAKALLTAWVQGLHPEGIFQDELGRVSGTPPEKPVVRFAPALVIRRRTQRNLIAVCDNIIKELREEGAEVPPTVRKIIGELGVDDQPGPEDEDGLDNGRHQDNETYFPLLYNDEQKRILHELNRQTGVLVQGPPGTGKSQTIANLICHLLATGKRILVTSQKAPALRVLKRFLDERAPAVAALCVMVLGEGTDAQHELKRSVGEIAVRHANRSPKQAKQKIARLRDDLKQAREEEARAFESLCALREKEVFQHTRRFGSYDGTLTQIADRVHREEEQFRWFEDRLPVGVSLLTDEAPELPFSIAKAQRLHAFLGEIDEQTKAQCSRRLLPVNQLPSAEQFGKMVEEEIQARGEFHQQMNGLSHPGRKALAEADDWILNGLLEALNELLVSLREIPNGSEKWVWEAVLQVLSGNQATWRALHETCRRLLTEIRSKPDGLAEVDVQGLGERSHSAVLQDAKVLHQHVLQDKRLGFWVFRPAVVKQGLYLVKETLVDGRLCNCAETLVKLINWLKLSEATRKLSEQWATVTGSVGDHLPLNQRIRAYEQCQTRLQAVFELAARAADLSQRLRKLSPELLCLWHDQQEVSSLRDLISALLAERRLTRASHAIADLEDGICSTNGEQSESVPENHAIRNAINERLVNEYTRAHTELTALWYWRRKLDERTGLIKDLENNLPKLAQCLVTTHSDADWKKRLSQLSAAWNWVCADYWLAELAAPGAEQELEHRIRQCRKEAAAGLALLAAELAWEHCLTELSEGSLQSLMAWRKAIERLGKGTGKYAERNRRIARQRLEECRGAIPAWVMPFYKVIDTVSMAQGIFDVVIIDEASQSGLDALVLSYLAKQVVVVGDDQQIRPENVGIDHNEVHQLQRRFLREIPKWDIFSPTESLFSIAEVRFGHVIRLREHFRCMPEIIAFSNQLCYQDQPLIPLRQFGRERLSPVLHTHYVEAGYQAGKSGPNPVEAEQIVEDMVRCCYDPAYIGKTFGVISLLSTSNQDREIEQLLLKRLDSEEIAERNIVCGAAYDFQGDERDVIFLSMVSARSEHGRIGTLAGEKAKRRFNVAFSRARDQVHLFHSVQEEDLSQSCLRRRLLAYMKNPVLDNSVLPLDMQSVTELRLMAHRARRAVEKPPRPFDSWFEVDVYLAITERGHLVVPQYEVSGYFIDLVVAGGTQKLAVECDGDKWHGPDRYAEDMRRQRELERCGWEFFRVRGSNYYRDPVAALTPLWAMIAEPEDNESCEDEIGITNILCKQSKFDQVSQPNSSPLGEQEPDIENEKAPLVNREESHQSSEGEQAGISISEGVIDSSKDYSVNDLLSLTNRELGQIICEILKDRPNSSAKMDDVTTYICKRFGVITRGAPRIKLKENVSWSISQLKKDGLVEEYKAKNLRVRLI